MNKNGNKIKFMCALAHKIIFSLGFKKRTCNLCSVQVKFQLGQTFRSNPHLDGNGGGGGV
jgi:hypothetical protein